MQPHLRVKLYMLASSLFDEPDGERTDFHFSLVSHLLRNGPAGWPFGGLLQSLERDLVYGTEDNLMGEYRRLFMGLDDGRVPQRSEYWLPVAAMRKLMASPGMAMLGSSEEAALLIAQLEFMAFLVADDENSRSLQRYFHEHCLSRWVPRFAQAVFEETTMPRYHLAAGFLLKLMAVERDFLLQPKPHLRVAA